MSSTMRRHERSKSTGQPTASMRFITVFIQQFSDYKTQVEQNQSETQKRIQDYLVKSNPVQKVRRSASSKIINRLSSAPTPVEKEQARAREYANAMKLLNRPKIENEIESIAKLLAALYQELLESCSLQGASTFANMCFSLISYNLEKNLLTGLDQLLKAPLLQCVLIKSVDQFTDKDVIEMREIDAKGRRVRHVIENLTLYCKQNGLFYGLDGKVKKANTGFLQFEETRDIEDFEQFYKEVNRDAAFNYLSPATGRELRKASYLQNKQHALDQIVTPRTPRVGRLKQKGDSNEESSNAHSTDSMESSIVGSRSLTY